MKTAFLFSGQGSQYIGMGKDLYDSEPLIREIFDQTSLDFDLKQVCFTGPEEVLQDTSYAQACIFTLSSAIAEVLRSHGIHADVCAGLSLGEYSAYAYANSITIQEGAYLTRERGKLMAHSLPEGTSSMAAIMMLDETLIKEACQKAQAQTGGICEIANYNCPGQIVITGSKEAVAVGMEFCKAAGARRCVPLKVSGAFHSSLLSDAAITLGQVLDTCTIKQPELPVYNNISGRAESGSIKEILMKQICHSVYFEQTIRNLYEDGVRRFIEIGPGSTISGFVKKTCKGKDDIEMMHVEDRATLNQVLQAWEVA